jgi:hypothetical protein
MRPGDAIRIHGEAIPNQLRLEQTENIGDSPAPARNRDLDEAINRGEIDIVSDFLRL